MHKLFGEGQKVLTDVKGLFNRVEYEAAGFIGSNLCESILRRGYKVRCLVDLSTEKQANV